MQPSDADLALEAVLGVCVLLVDQGQELGELGDDLDVLGRDVAFSDGVFIGCTGPLGFGGLDGAIFDFGG